MPFNAASAGDNAGKGSRAPLLNRRRLIIAAAAGCVALAALIAYLALRETKADRFLKWIEKTAAVLPQVSHDDYLKFTVFPEKEFALYYNAVSYVLKPNDFKAYLERARDVRKYLAGAKITVVASDVTVEPRPCGAEAVAKVLIKWVPADKAEIPIEYQTLGVEIEGSETADGWKAYSVKVYTTSEVMNLMKSRAFELLRRKEP
jgi:hypothetical protein